MPPLFRTSAPRKANGKRARSAGPGSAPCSGWESRRPNKNKFLFVIFTPPCQTFRGCVQDELRGSPLEWQATFRPAVARSECGGDYLPSVVQTRHDFTARFFLIDTTDEVQPAQINSRPDSLTDIKLFGATSSSSFKVYLDGTT